MSKEYFTQNIEDVGPPMNRARTSKSSSLRPGKLNAISIVICTKNEEANISSVLEKCRLFADELIVVDGHSKDLTREIARSFGAIVYLDNNKGKGDAIRVGIKNAAGDIIVFLDADGSHSPQDIPKLIEPIEKGECDHVTGSRMRGGSDELHGDIGKFIRMLGSDIITLGINYRFDVRLTDSQNGFRAIRADVAKNLSLKENITTIEQEMIIKTLKAGFRMGEVPAHEYARKFGKSNIKISRVGWRYVYSWLRYLFFN
jgi:glycosyltransferase involved in cell wall biosynthesis